MIIMAEEDTDWSYSYSPVPTLSSGLEKGYDGEHTNLLSHPGLRADDTHLLSHPGLRADGTIVSSPLLRTTRIDPELQARLEGMDTRSRISTERRQLNGGLRYSTRERSYQDSGFSEETDIQMNPVATTTYLAKTKSGTIYIEPSDDAKIPMSHYSQPLMPGSQSDSSTNDRTLSQRLRSPGDTSTPPSSAYPHHPLKLGNSVYGSKTGTSSMKTGSGYGYGPGVGGGARCSWRSLAVVFIVLTLAMAATSVFLVGKDPAKLGFLTSEQALADYAELINYIKLKNPNAANSPVIAFGGSYGGMLAAWFRIKYPHVCAGAIAASAPVAQFTSPCDAFGRIVTSDYTAAVANGTCSQNIRKSWAALDRLANQTNGTGLDWINKNWKLCTPFTHRTNVTLLKNYLNEMWTNIAMMDYPYPTSFLVPLPGNPVNAVCSKLEGSYSTDVELISHVAEAAAIYYNFSGTAKCLNLAETDDIGADMWNYQACSEMVMPFCYDGVNDMFEAAKWDVRQFSKDCLRDWNVVPRPNMANLMYGGRALEAASNIVFSNGLLDPWSSGGILKAHGTVVTVIIPEGAHHLDLRASNPGDPQSVIDARKTERKFIRKWITVANRNLKRKPYFIP